MQNFRQAGGIPGIADQTKEKRPGNRKGTESQAVFFRNALVQWG